MRTLVKGDIVRVKDDVVVGKNVDPVGGRTGTVQKAEAPTPASEFAKGSMAYLVLFDDPSDKDWIHFLSDCWFNDYELEVLDGIP
jgi:hypothetical protein